MKLEKTNLDDPCFSFYNKFQRIIWGMVYILLFRFTPSPFFTFRRYVLLIFGAKVDPTARIYPTVKIWLPKNLHIGSKSTIGPNSIIYNQGKITIKDRVIISQGSHICASTHNYNIRTHPLILAPVTIESDVWICADAFIGPGVNVSEGGVVGARAVIKKNTDVWSVYAGTPAVKLKERNRFDIND